VHVLGKNGEPKTGTEIEITLTYVYSSNTENFPLKTNAQGVVSLGNLKNVEIV
jgi:hypothetical protein